MEEEEAGTPPRLKVVTAKLCNGEKENSNEVSTLKKTLEKAKKGRMQRWKEHGVSRSSNRKSQQFRLNSFFFRGGCWFGWTWLRISLGEEECLFFLGGGETWERQTKKARVFLGEKRKGGEFPEYSTVIYFLSIRRYVSCIKTQWRFSLQPPTLHATFCET